MSDNNINVTAPIHAATKKGKLGAAKQIFLEGDTQTVEKEIQDINSRHNDLSSKHESLSSTVSDHAKQIESNQSQITANKSAQDEKNTSLDANMAKLNTRDDQITELVRGVTATGGASVATAVTYDNTSSNLDAATVQGAVDELVAKKVSKEDIAQELGDSKDKVISQFALPFRYVQNEEFIFAKVDAEDKLLFGILWDGTPKFGKTSEVEDELQEQITILAERVAAIMGDEDITSTIDTLNELKTFFANIENTQSLTDILANLDNVAKNLDKTTIKDEEGNVQDTPFRVIENEEFIMAVEDSENRVLFGIYRATGKPYYPLNDMYHISHSEEFLWVILDAENHPLLGIKEDGTCWAAKAQWLDDIKAIKEALSNIDETLKTFQPKEDGKGLINLDVADSFFYISNDEYIIAVVDAENRIIAGIKYDAQPYFPNHEMYSVITNEEWLYAIIDAESKVLCGFRANDGHMIVGDIDISTFITNAIIDIADIKERTSHLSTIKNDEYLSVETDSDGKVIGYTSHDGSHYLYKVKSETIPTEFEHIEDSEGRIEITTDAEGKVLSATNADGSHYIHNVKSETIPEEFSHIEDPEGRSEITLDSEGKLLGYRDSKGIRHEQNMQIDHFYKNGREINYASEDYVDNKPLDTEKIDTDVLEDKIRLSKLEGVKDYSYPNLFNSRSIQKYDSAFADKVYEAIGRKTGETGCYSNFIDCKEGDWFTRNDFGTGIVVVCDGKRNIIGDVKDVAYKPTFQIKASEGQDFSEVRYVVMVVMLANINSQRIVKAKYITDRTEDTLRIPKLRIGQDNLEMGVVPYIKATSGNFYSLSIDDSTSPQIVLNKLDGIPVSELPNDFPKFSFSGDFSEYLDSLVMCPIEGGETYLFELGKNGLVKRYLNKKVNCARVIKESGTAYIYGCDGGLNTSSGKLNIFRANNRTFDVVKSNITTTDGQLLEPHDCLVLSVSPLHIITQRYIPNQTTVVDGISKKITSLHIEEQYEGKRIWIWKSEDHPDLWKDSHYQADNADYLHNNTICLTTEGNVMLNNKHANQILILERTWNESSHTGTIGDILYKIGGDHNKVSYDVSNRIKTTKEQQWFESHDAEMRDDGSITMFDNEPSYPSRILDFKIDTVNKCLKDFKSYSFEKYHGRYMGSAQKLADGVYLVSWGSVRDGGTPNLGIYDFNKNKKIFELKFDALAYSTYRVYGITV